MSISVSDFWRLLVESRLVSPDEARQAADELARTKPAVADDLQQLARWFVQSGRVSRYQAKVLLAGRPGPFVYGDYLVHDRSDSARLNGLFRARHLPTKHPVGLFFLTGPALDDPQSLLRLVPQVAVARQASRSEPRLSACHHLVDLGKFKFLVVDDLRGQSLGEQLTKSPARLSVAASCRLLRSVAQGAARMHALGQAHGHIRPDNIWLDEVGAAKLLQFPLVGDPLAARTPPVLVDAQIDYLAPELAGADAIPDPRSDVYSLGCLLFALLAGQPPFAGGDRRSRLARHAKEAPPSISKLNPQLPAALGQVLRYLLQKDPTKRYADAAAVAEALQAYAGAELQMTAEPTTAAYEAWLQQAERGLASAPEAAPAARPVVVRAVGANGGVTAPVPASPVQLATAVSPGFQPAAAVPQASVAATPAVAFQPATAVAFPGPIGQAEVTPPLPSTGTATMPYRRAKKKGQAATTIGVIACAIVLLLGVVWFLQSQNEESRPPVSDETAKPPVEQTAAAASNADEETEAKSKGLDAHVAEQGSAAREPIQGIGQPIWQSPTDGEPLDLAWLPPGAQVILALRPAQLAQQGEWDKLIDKRTGGTVSEWLASDLPKTTGKPLDRLETVVVGLLDGSPGPPKVALVARSGEDFALDDLRAGWGDAKEEEIEGHAIHVHSGRAFYLPASGDDKLLVIGPAAELRELVKSGGEAPVLRREMEVLLESSDNQRQLTLLVAPNFPLTDGKALFVDEGVKLLGPLRDFLELKESDGKLELPKAAMLSCHLSDNFFVELRIYDNFGQPAQKAAQEYQGRVGRLPRQVSGYVRDLALSTYSKPILWDYKDQLDVLSQFTRLGVEGKQIVLRAYLPTTAAHNLVLGAHLAVLENRGTGAVVAVTPAATPPKEQTIADKLKKKTTLTFPRNTLEQSMKLLGDDIGVEIIILGNDLREEGITKNQSFELNEMDQPGGEILRKIMLKANPDGKLVYVIKPKKGGGEDALYVTTRAAVKKRGDTLPPELDSK
ncbi:MAG TPA: protein kinase [Pirellulales bacterium]|nr:protein kinase [Pirellulales bacterium]